MLNINFLKSIKNKERNDIQFNKITEELIINTNNEELEWLRSVTFIRIKDMFYIYAPSELRVKSQKWIDWKRSALLELKRIFCDVMGEMVHREEFSSEEIKEYQVKFNQLFEEQEKVLNNIKVREIKIDNRDKEDKEIEKIINYIKEAYNQNKEKPCKIADVLDYVKSNYGITKKLTKSIIAEMSKRDMTELTRWSFTKNIKIGDYNVSYIRLLN